MITALKFQFELRVGSSFSLATLFGQKMLNQCYFSGWCYKTFSNLFLLKLAVNAVFCLSVFFIFNQCLLVSSVRYSFKVLLMLILLFRDKISSVDSHNFLVWFMILDCKRVVTALVFMAQVFHSIFILTGMVFFFCPHLCNHIGKSVLHDVSQGPKSYPDG